MPRGSLEFIKVEATTLFALNGEVQEEEENA
jgi:hypothetical protein